MTDYVSEDMARTVKQLCIERELKKIANRRKIEELREKKEFDRLYNYED